MPRFIINTLLKNLKLLFFNIFIFLVILFLSYHGRVDSMPYFLKINAKSTTDSLAQVFFNTNGGYNELESSTTQITSSLQYEELNFDLPKKIIKNLRFDPLCKPGTVIVKDATIYGRKEMNNQYKILHQFDLKSFKPLNGVTTTEYNSSSLIIHVSESDNDPKIEIKLNKPLNHWRLKDFFDEKWYKYLFFLFLLSSPIIIYMNFVIIRKSKGISMLDFIINGKVFSLRKNQYFQSSQSCNYYRDTEEGILKFIIEEVKNGKEWIIAVNDYYSKSNPWLNDIITSSKRIRFIQDFINPNRLTILDIGAGWGQFSIPLAKNNVVCALEPTPERLEFIREVSIQEKVSDNIFFLGTNYFNTIFKSKFDLILSIGVLEWVEKFKESSISSGKAQFTFLKKIRDDLTHNGKLIIGIENRLGLKYLLGANDDHIGIPHITYLNKILAKKKYNEKTNEELQCFTYSLVEYRNLLTKARFKQIKFYAALPDYKLPTNIFPISNDFQKCELNNFIVNGGRIQEHDGSNGKSLENQEELNSIYLSLSELNIAHYFSPSFYIIAS